MPSEPAEVLLCTLFYLVAYGATVPDRPVSTLTSVMGSVTLTEALLIAVYFMHLQCSSPLPQSVGNRQPSVADHSPARDDR